MENELKKELKVLIEESSDIDIDTKNRIINLVQKSEISKSLIKIKENKDLLTEVENILLFSKKLESLKNQADIEELMSLENVLNFKKLRKLFEDKKLIKKYPNFKIDKLIELLKNPPLKIKNHDGETIEYDPFYAKKMMIAIVQMIFDEMDYHELTIGIEGSGKSCSTSKRILFVHTVLFEIGIINYALQKEGMIFTSLSKLLEAYEMQPNDDYFRIYWYDEANEVGRLNYRDELNMIFKYDLRTSRRKQKLVFMNVQQLGEIDITLTLSRVNFMFDCRVKNNIETGTLDKGEKRMYIIPRSEYIYSDYHKKTFSREEVKRMFADILSKKTEYYVSLPEECIIRKFEENGLWGIDHNEYSEFVKKQNKMRQIESTSQKLSDYIAFIIYKKAPKSILKDWNFNMNNEKEKRMYYTFQKFIKKLKNRFLEDERLLNRFEKA
ncbi:MAG: hypothetical protein ACFFDN_01415 [Candidatus Hodarchaeota archaeon]